MDLQSSVAEALINAPDTLFGREEAKTIITEFFSLGFDTTYTINFNQKDIAKHVYGYMCARAVQAAGKTLAYQQEGAKEAFYICEGSYFSQMHTVQLMEQWLSQKNKDLGATHAISIRSYHSQEIASPCILLVAEFCPFIESSGTKGEDFRNLTTEKFMRLRPKETRERYESIVRKMEDSIKPVYTVNAIGDGVLALKMCFIPDRVSYMAPLITLINSISGAVVCKKFCETMSNGMHVYTYYVRGAQMNELVQAAGLIGMLPNYPKRVTTKLYNSNMIDANEVIYYNSLIHFAFFFTPPSRNEDFSELARELRHKAMAGRRLINLRKEMFQSIMSMDFISKVVMEHIDLLKLIFKDFMTGPTPESCASLQTLLASQLTQTSALTRSIFATFITFNRSVIKTNFFKVNKAAVAYRLDPSFLKEMDYPRVPFGIFFLVGPQFIGFHIRFTDIARGGVRMIISRSHQYDKNRQTLFGENYNLAYAQLLKNKDIPEGGSKGTILVHPTSTYDRRRTFLQYVDALLDLIIPGVEGVRSTMKEPEIIFLGPDENTAGAFPAYAALHAKARGYSWWKSFTTGKAPQLGGIPHDTYGMTTRGVRTFAEEMYKKLELDQASLTKFQTGGPDGDLGSNEILLSKETYKCLVDGSGSLYDPEGLNRDELVRLAKKRATLSEYDVSKLSARGFFVNVKDKDRKLPDGTLVQNGEQFRNSFHFSPYCVTDTFIPCGGRPSSINLDNVHKLVLGVEVTGQSMIDGKVGNLADSPGKLRFRYIVEGANLFITHDARIALENVGVILIKDSSANKGGVTCSSLEVLSGLSLLDAEHKDNMCVGPSGSDAPEFYKRYVDEVIGILYRNAAREFECVWKERKAKTHQGLITHISDSISSKIVEIRQFINNSDLHEDQTLYRYVLRRYIPSTLQEKVPLNLILERVPTPYLRAIFAIWIASDFVYTSGIAQANEFQFFTYMGQLSKKAHGDSSSKL
jgi:glutamate dehydrogenase